MVLVEKMSEGKYKVKVEESGSATEHIVTLDDSYYQKLTGGRITPEQLIEKSFQFLLNRESKESILSQFKLKTIGFYFPEYENEIQQM